MTSFPVLLNGHPLPSDWWSTPQGEISKVRIALDSLIKGLCYTIFELAYIFNSTAITTSKELVVKGAVKSAGTFYHIASRSKNERPVTFYQALKMADH